MAVLLDIPLFGWALRRYYIATKYRAIERARLSYEVILASDPLTLKVLHPGMVPWRGVSSGEYTELFSPDVD